MTQASNPASHSGEGGDDLTAMRRALTLAASVRTHTAPNPWVGCVIVTAEGEHFEGATAPPSGPHAEATALAAAGDKARGATLYSTLEPCAHHGRTGPCAAAIASAGLSRVVVGIVDPDPQVAGRGIEHLRRHAVQVDVGVGADEVEECLAPYLKHRRTGRPWVILKLAATLDGRIAAPDGTSKWLTSAAARADVQHLRAQSDAVLVGAGTVRADDPALTVRPEPQPEHQPLRVVLGRVPADARVQPAVEMSGTPQTILEELGAKGVLQVLVEGGAHVAYDFHRAGVVDRYVVYVAPALFGGDDGVPLFAGPGAPTMGELWRGRLVSVERLGDDVRIELTRDSDGEKGA